MPYIAYQEPKRFRQASIQIIELADQIATQYRASGYNLTLRQLYYQFIARDFFPNTEQSYNRLGAIINDARLQGLIDWDHIEDRGREAHDVSWLGTTPPTFEQQIRYLQYTHSLDLWREQPRRIEIWVEKQALEEVAQKAARQFRVGYFACKGYVSQSEMWRAGQRLRDALDEGQQPLILHLGDHDPSGIDMTRDIQDRLTMFAEEPIEVRRLALNMGQIRELNPPPNPAKVTDSRAASYIQKFGRKSWELDAISPDRLVEIITDEIEQEVDLVPFNEARREEREGRQVYIDLADNWEDAERVLREAGLI
ncbi:DNA binding protein [Microbacterium phage Fizzles]|nr:DNA binding protein [Microbacterium phage Fizzles]